MPKIICNHAEFYYELHGQGHPLILIAGYTCDHTFWFPLLTQLKKRFRVLIFDNRWVGQTKDAGKDLSIKLMAEDVMALAHALELQAPHIVGHSMGSYIAQSVALHYGAQIGKWGLLGASPKLRLAALKALKSHVLLREQGADFQILCEVSIPWFFGEFFLSDEQNIEKAKRLMLDNPHPQTLADQKRQLQALEDFQGMENLQTTSSSVFIGCGSEDLIASLVNHNFWPTRFLMQNL